MTKDDRRILTRRPDQDKPGARIDAGRYETMRQAIIAELERTGGKDTFFGLRNKVRRRLNGKFSGSVGWHYTVVELDLEARGVLERLGRSHPQLIRLVPSDSR